MHRTGPDEQERALGALYGLALGDALGMPTQELSRSAAADLLGGSEPRLLAAAADHPLAAGLPAGSVTDDTEQALVLARLVVAGGGRIDPRRLADDLLAWQQQMVERGSLDLLGPSTQRALTAIAAGDDPAQTGRFGATNGAAMRIAPIGIATPPEPLANLLDAVVDADRPTHDTGLAHAGAAAIATVVSWGVAGEGFTTALPRAVAAAREAGRRGHHVAGADVASRIGWAVDLSRQTARRHGSHAALDAVDQLVGTSLATQESVPAAFAVAALSPDDPWQACWWAAGLGGDSDTIAAMVGAMLGACNGLASFPADAVEQVSTVNGLDLAGLAHALLTIRRDAGGGSR